MTDEQSFQDTLDETPEDHIVRLMLADYLDGLGDPRGHGYRALGRCRLNPRYSPVSPNVLAFVDPFDNRDYYVHYPTGMPVWKGHPFTWIKTIPLSTGFYLPWYWFDVVAFQNPEARELAAAAAPRNGWSAQADNENPVPLMELPPNPTALPSLPFKTRREAEDAAASAFPYMPRVYRESLLRGDPR